MIHPGIIDRSFNIYIWSSACASVSKTFLSNNLKSIDDIWQMQFTKTSVLHGYAIWYLILRGRHRLRVFENKMLWRIFGPRWIKWQEGKELLHNEKHHILQSSPSILRVIKSSSLSWAGYIACMEWKRIHVSWRMASCGRLRRVALVRTEVLVEISASILCISS
jgi:hypothetical protein